MMEKNNAQNGRASVNFDDEQRLLNKTNDKEKEDDDN